MEELFQQRKEKLNLFKALIRPPKPVKPKEVPTGLYTRCTDCGQDILSEVKKEVDKRYHYWYFPDNPCKC